MNPPLPRAVTRMIVGVVVPAHNEAARIAACLRSVEQAAAVPALRDVVVHIIVVCDACTDRTREIVESLGHRAVASEARNVGRARGLGADAALRTRREVAGIHRCRHRRLTALARRPARP